MYSGATLQDIAEVVQDLGCLNSFTRERVRQILNKEGLPTKNVSAPLPLCYWCRAIRVSMKNNKGCNDPICKRDRSSRVVNCNYCGKDKRVPLGVYERNINEARGIISKTRNRDDIPHYKGFFYCNRKCFGKWLGKTHGRGVQTREG